MQVRHFVGFSSLMLLMLSFQNCSPGFVSKKTDNKDNATRSPSSSTVGAQRIRTNSAVVDSLNEQIAAGSQALDYVIQNVCVDSNDNVVAGDPANCPSHRNVKIGERLPYILTDVDRANNNATYQGLFSYPVPGVDGTLKILVSKNMQGNFSSAFSYDYTMARDGFDLLDVSGSYISAIRTSDPGCFDQIISSPSERRNGWIFFAPGGGGGSLNHDIRIERISSPLPSGCGQVSQSSGNSTQDIWDPPAAVRFESGKVLQAIQTYHVAHWNLSQQNNAIEKYYFTREYGFTRWEAWIPRNRCYAEQRWYCNAPSAALGGRCGDTDTVNWGGQVWVRVDCRDSTNHIALSTPVLPLTGAMANGDVDSNAVLNLVKVSEPEPAPVVAPIAETPPPVAAPVELAPVVPVVVAPSPFGVWTGNGVDSYHQVGKASGTGWEVVANGQPGVLTFGPYVSGIPAGNLKAVFSLMIDNNTANNEPLIDVDVYRHSTGTMYAQMTITRGQFNNAMTLQQFELPFVYDGGGKLEFRVSVRGNSYIHHAGTSVWNQ